MPLSIAKPVCYLALGGPRGHPGIPLAREHDRSRYVSFLSLPILKPMFIHRTNTLLPLWQSLIWLGYEIVFSLANHTIDNSILFSQLYSAAQRCVRKLRPTSTMGLRVMCEMKRHLESACGQMQVPHEKQIDARLVVSPFV